MNRRRWMVLFGLAASAAAGVAPTLMPGGYSWISGIFSESTAHK